MQMEVYLPGMLMGMQVPALAPNRIRQGSAEHNEHHSYRELQRKGQGLRNGHFEDDDSATDHQEDNGMPKPPAEPDEPGRSRITIATEDGGDGYQVVGIQRMTRPE